MYGTEAQFKVGDRVRLRDGLDSTAYNGMAKVGNEGWIEGLRRDRFGLPEVFIHWDPDHWAYNRQPNQWTFQEHFDRIEEERQLSDQDRREAASAIAQRFADEMSTLFSDQPQPTAEGSSAPETAVSAEAGYIRCAQEAAEGIPGSEAFVTITVSRQPDDRAPQGALVVDVNGDSLTPEAEALLGSQIAALGAQFHRNLAVLQIQQLSAGHDGGPEPTV